MNRSQRNRSWRGYGSRRAARWLFLLLSGCIPALLAQENSPVAQAAQPQLTQAVAIEGTNWWIAPAGAADWVLASTQMPHNLRTGDRIRTGRHTRLYLRTAQLGVIQVPPFTTLEIAPPSAGEQSVLVRLWRGMIYFFHRGAPGDVEVRSQSATAAIRGTEFTAKAGEDGGLVIQVVDGEVALKNDQGTVMLGSGDKGTASPGRMPTRTPFLEAVNVIQWFLYYPAVIDPDELPWRAEEKSVLSESLQAYREGDLPAALDRYPADRDPQSPQERVYRAALALAVGQVDRSEEWLEPLSNSDQASSVSGRLADALRLLVAAVQGKPRQPGSPPRLASEWLAESYYLQSESKLPEALQAAREAAVQAPDFGPAWIRVAELEFSFGRMDTVEQALRTGLDHSPRQAAGLTLRGFIFAARNDPSKALAAFEEALALDPGLGNAWLGRGLCRLRRGRVREGLEDLEMAAAVEPHRALLRSYLGKAFDAAGDPERAAKELDLAKAMDPNDPTAWLYAALLDQRRNRINKGVRDLETSKALNAQRQVYRSRHLLDEDQAVRGANLAALYRDAGMVDLSRREAADAVNADYANYSAHLFLANSYNELRDPGQVDLRYESAWFNEYLLANLLTPPNAGALSQTVSQQEYSRLFDRNRVGLVSQTEYASRGDWIQSAAHYGIYGDFAYALEEDYRFAHGQRPNNDLEQLTLSLHLKQQLGLDDSLYFQAVYYDADGGDLARVYDPENPAYYRSRYRFQENQEPLLLAGYHHQWSPGQHTLLLGGRLQDELSAQDPSQPVLLVSKDPNQTVTGTVLTSVEQRYRSELEIYSAEIQHIAEFHPWTFIAGARYQFGTFDTENRQQNLADLTASLPEPLDQKIDSEMHRFAAYGYGEWQAADSLSLFAGLSYDYLRYPVNFRFAPLSEEEDSRDQLSPKAGLIWKPTAASTLRGAYTRSLGGVSLEQSYRLEPSQVAGFNQAWRSLIPESVVGAQSGARFESGSLEWDQHWPSRTYLAVRGDLIRSDASRQVGVFDLPFLAEPSTTRETLDYEEQTLNVTLNQLIGEVWAMGLGYRLSKAHLEDDFPGIPPGASHFFEPYELKPRQTLESTLHQLRLYALFNHPSGLFARFESIWSAQSNQGYDPARPGDDFWQFNLYAGYRFPGRRAELRLGVLNLTDQDYRLNPLNLTPDLPRDRTFTAGLRLNF
jgi:tetratricopeptide (TPR) repeat protein